MSRLSSRLIVRCVLLLSATGWAVANADTLRVPQDFATIQAAIDAAAQGDVVMVSKGAYDETLTLLNKPGVTLAAKGKVVVDAGNGITPPLTIDGSDGAIVRGLRFLADAVDGVVVTQSAHVVLDGVRVSAGGAGIQVLDGAGIHLRKCRVDASGQEGIAMAADRSFVDRCSVAGAGTQGIRIGGDGVVVADCKVSGAGTEGVFVIGAGALVEGTRIRDTAGDGLSASSGTASLFRGNVVKDAGGSGIFVLGAQVRAEGNRVSGAGADGIRVAGDDAVLVENRVVKTVDAGIRVAGGATGAVLHANVSVSAGGDAYSLEGNDALVARNVAKKAGDADHHVNGTGVVLVPVGSLQLAPATKRVPQDFATIQAAIDAAMVGDVVEIAAGTYTESLDVDGVTLLTLKAKGKVIVDGGANASALRVQNSLVVMVEGLEFQNAFDTVSLASTNFVALTRVTIRDGGGAGIQSSADALRLDRVKVYDTASTGIIAGGNGALVERCTVTGAGHEGIRLSGARAVATRNRVSDSAAGGVAVGAAAAGIVASRNTVMAAGGAGMSADAGAAAVHFTRNQVKDAVSHGIAVATDDATLTANSVSGASGDGIRFGGAAGKAAANAVTKNAGAMAYHLLDAVAGGFHHENRVSKSAGDGVFVEAATADCVFTRNRATKSGGIDFFSLAALGDLVVLENAFGTTVP